MSTLIARRFLGLVAIALLSSFVVFLIPFITPGDPVRKLLRARMDVGPADAAAVQAYAQQFGLDAPLWRQFLSWVTRFLTGDMGISYTSLTPVFDQVMPATAITLTLAGGAMVVAVLISLALGLVCAVSTGRWPDRVITSFTHALVSIPEYAIAPLLVVIFALKLALLPSAGWAGPASWVLPIVVLALRPISFFTVAVRSGMLDALAKEHIVAARARGLGERRTVLTHVIPHGLLPLWTMMGVWFAGLLGGSVIVEVIFAIPGMGRLVYEAVLNADIPVAQGGVVVVVVLAVVVTTLVDLGHVAFDPTVRSRIRHA
ncbi:ABC transporter permease [Arthrobacter psychrolactophilus]|uniref:ABC transporter permease n=1 Tax=Arthrobacter psychrolactophilus TaxID=92442 RepID=A0A2V5ISR6_9MICC|nr:ABC transporter permease [Arthrobacter psychrolactophilus]PYI37183.1 ABC transporter permease [Arthrobacter psychrolactophilus]